ncbi:ABC transporter permease [Kutzneria sp. NPDC051319]|uniref:ABC transporter permease n=1 Tax=Kutzneria sp. NPDC051319 TaxID=3155047 RepID=UPI00341A6151
MTAPVQARPGPAPVRLSSRVGLRATLRHSLAIARRNLVQLRNDPEQLLDATLMPMAMTLIFVYVFGGAIAHDQGDYRQFLIPGIMVQTANFAARSTGIGLSFDFDNGLMDRFRALPIARSAMLWGRIAADSCRMLLGQLVMLAFALIIGFRVQTGFLALVEALAVLMVYGIALCWVSAYIGLVLRNPQTVQSVGFLWTVPLQFGSSMFVPTDTMPDWLRVFAAFNPTSAVVDTCRGLLGGGPVMEPLLHTLAWVAVFVVVFAPLSVRQYRRRG